MLVDLKIKDKQIIIVGGNGEVELKTKKLIDAKEILVSHWLSLR